MLPRVHGEFRLAADPELKFTPSGAACGSLRLVASQRKKDEATGDWVDGKTCWIDGTLWRDAAEHAVESYRRGDLVVIVGEIHTDEWEDRETGGKRSKTALTILEIGLSTRFRDIPRGESERRVERSREPVGSDPWQGGVQPEEPPF